MRNILHQLGLRLKLCLLLLLFGFLALIFPNFVANIMIDVGELTKKKMKET